MNGRNLSIVVVLGLLAAVGWWFLRDRGTDSGDDPVTFRFLDWVAENDFESGATGVIEDVARIEFDDPESIAGVSRTEDVGPLEVRDRALRVKATGKRPRVVFHLNRQALDGNAVFVQMAGAGTRDEPRFGWFGKQGGRRMTSRGAIPLIEVQWKGDSRFVDSQFPDDSKLYYFPLDEQRTWRGHVDEIYVQPGIGEGDEVAISLVTLNMVPLSARWMQFEEKEALSGRVSIGFEAREVVLAVPTSRIDVSLRPGPDAVFDFGYGVLAGGWRGVHDGVRFEVRTRLPEGEETTLFERTLDPVHDPAHRTWFRDRVDLSPYAGTEIMLTLVTQRVGGDTGKQREIPAVWCAPTVYSPREPAPAVDGALPNVLLVSLDTMRADRLGCQGHPVSTTPTLDRFAMDNIQFSRAHSHAPSTGPSHMSLFTSLYPTVHGVVGQDWSLQESVVTMAETLREAGYFTEALTNGGYIRGELGFYQGFDSYLDNPYNTTASEGRVDDMVDKALASLERFRDRPFFLFLHTYEVHVPYCPVEPLADLFDPSYSGDFGDCISAQLIDEVNHGCMGCEDLSDDTYGTNPPSDRDIEHIDRLYDAGVRQTDAAMNRLLARLDELELRDNTIVIFFADHGEDLGDHRDVGRHARSLYEEVLHIPLIMRLPGMVEGPRLIESPIALMDVLPTLVDLLGLSRIDQYQGYSYASLLRGEETEDEASLRPLLFSQNFRYGSAVRLSLTEGRYKMIHTRTDEVFGTSRPLDFKSPSLRSLAPGYELFDMATDPAEWNNVYEDDDDVSARMRKDLEEIFREQRERSLGSKKIELSPGMVKRLQALGYLRDQESGEEDDGSESEGDER